MAKKIKKNGKKEIKKIIKELNLSNYEYIADDENITLSATAPQLVDFLNAPGIKKLFEQQVNMFNIPGRLVNRSGRMVMRIIKGFKEVDLLNSISDRLISFYQRLNPAPS